VRMSHPLHKRFSTAVSGSLLTRVCTRAEGTACGVCDGHDQRNSHGIEFHRTEHGVVYSKVAFTYARWGNELGPYWAGCVTLREMRSRCSAHLYAQACACCDWQLQLAARAQEGER